MNTVIIFTGPHYPADRHQFDNCNSTLTDSLRRMASRHRFPVRVKEGGAA